MSNLKKIEIFLENYQRFSEKIKKEKFVFFKQNFSELQEGYTLFKEELAKADKKEAFRYNIFSILNIRNYEEKTHTPFLRNLLETDGKHSHGQGGLFLRSFIENFIPERKKEYFKLEKENNYLVDEEYPTARYGRIDLYIHSLDPQKKFGIVVENKLYAGDQEKQLERYYKFLESRQYKGRKYKDEQMMLFYLTIEGKEPSLDSISEELKQCLKDRNILYNLSYKKDIRLWLENCNKNIKAKKIRNILESYLEVITDL